MSGERSPPSSSRHRHESSFESEQPPPYSQHQFTRPFTSAFPRPPSPPIQHQSPHCRSLPHRHLQRQEPHSPEENTMSERGLPTRSDNRCRHYGSSPSFSYLPSEWPRPREWPQHSHLQGQYDHPTRVSLSLSHHGCECHYQNAYSCESRPCHGHNPRRDHEHPSFSNVTSSSSSPIVTTVTTVTTTTAATTRARAEPIKKERQGFDVADPIVLDSDNCDDGGDHGNGFSSLSNGIASSSCSRKDPTPDLPKSTRACVSMPKVARSPPPLPHAGEKKKLRSVNYNRGHRLSWDRTSQNTSSDDNDSSDSDSRVWSDRDDDFLGRYEHGSDTSRRIHSGSRSRSRASSRSRKRSRSSRREIRVSSRVQSSSRNRQRGPSWSPEMTGRPNSLTSDKKHRDAGQGKEDAVPCSHHGQDEKKKREGMERYHTIDLNFPDEAANIMIFDESEPPEFLCRDSYRESLPMRILDDYDTYNILEVDGASLNRDRYQLAGLENFDREGYELRVSGGVESRPAVDVDDGVGYDNVYEEGDDNMGSSRTTAEPCVTPLVATLAGDLFGRTLNVAGSMTHHKDPAIYWARKPRQTSIRQLFGQYARQSAWIGDALGFDQGRTYHGSALVGDSKVSVGDCVLARVGKRPEPWLAKIMFMYEYEGRRWSHVRCFARGSETILMDQDMDGDGELYLLDHCGDISLDDLVRAWDIAFVSGDKKIPERGYFCRFWYRTSTCAFEDVQQHEHVKSKEYIFEDCQSCLRPATHSFSHNGHDFHERDFVYLLDCRVCNPSALYPNLRAKNVMMPVEDLSSVNPYTIGQIIEIVSPTLARVRLLERHDHFLDAHERITGYGNRIQKPIFKDCRRLVLTSRVQVFSVSALTGTCNVQFIPKQAHLDMEAQAALSEFKDKPDRFYYQDYLVSAPGAGPGEPEDVLKNSDKAKLRGRLASMLDLNLVRHEGKLISIEAATPCETCEERWAVEESKDDTFMAGVKKLRAMDIFSGCGGLSEGLRQTGVVETRYAIDFDESATRTFKHNFPDCTVYTEDANMLLRRAVDQHSGKEVPPRMDLAGIILPPMPAPGDVDLIYCGPPCQGFSFMNHHRKKGDLKNSLIATAMSFVDVYRPRYFLLENVRGILYFKADDNHERGGAHMGIVKFILKCLTSMGYQCRFGLLQAGHHGLPQCRRRFFVWAARLGCTLPEFPLPGTCFAHNSSLRISPPKGLEDHTTFSLQRQRSFQAPDPAITVRDAIGDLPGFEYTNPHKAYEGSDDEQKEDRLDGSIIHVDRYLTRPQSEFQRRLRAGRQEHDPILNHITRPLKDITVERICHVAMEPESDHRSLPELLRPWCLSSPDSSAPRRNYCPGSFGRLDFDGNFQTTMTGLRLLGTQGRVIHPNQNRLLSVRECARSQGFPDGFEFLSVPATGRGAGGGGGGGGRGEASRMYRQVGNAVPPPLAKALGEKLKEAMRKDAESGNEV